MSYRSLEPMGSGQGEPTSLLPRLDGSLLCFLISSASILEGGCPCERNLRGVFFYAWLSTSSLLNVKHGLIPYVSPFSSVFLSILYKYNRHIIILKMLFIQIQNERLLEGRF